MAGVSSGGKSASYAAERPSRASSSWANLRRRSWRVAEGRGTGRGGGARHRAAWPALEGDEGEKVLEAAVSGTVGEVELEGTGAEWA
eukprot:scaffold2541_cov122-Isochrysis_galbana.AAC.4